MTHTHANQTALITGASRGIGAAIARRLAAQGADLLLHYSSSQTSAEALRDEIADAGGRARLVQEDLSLPEGPAALAAKVGDLLGDRRLDILVNNAGVVEYTSFEDTDAGVLDRQFAVNVRAPFLLTAALFERLADGGSVVFTSSIVARTYFDGVPGYSVTKGAVDTLVRHLAGHLGARGIRVNAVAPGAIATDMSSWLDSPEGEATAKGIQALQRIGQPDDIARVAAFLAAPDSGWITGQVIDASGGSKL